MYVLCGGRCGAGCILMMSPVAMAPQPEHLSGGGGQTDHQLPRTPITLPPHREHVPTRSRLIAMPFLYSFLGVLGSLDGGGASISKGLTGVKDSLNVVTV